ncbi:hypothetical protein ACIQCJ_14585 [Streptomyces sp. NPDC093221]|uniref:hypothetical protein n=1 Tax=Streptomyces sp. NPDC093221 TaxID=3366032 RepID=UPI003829E7EA
MTLREDVLASFPVYDCASSLVPVTSPMTLCSGSDSEVTVIGLTRGIRARTDPWISVFSFSPQFERGVEFADFANWALLHLAEDLSTDLPEGPVRKWVIRDVSYLTSIDPDGQPHSVAIDGTATPARRWNVPGEGWVVTAPHRGGGVAVSAHCIDEVPHLTRAEESVWQSAIQAEVRRFKNGTIQEAVSRGGAATRPCS